MYIILSNKIQSLLFLSLLAALLSVISGCDSTPPKPMKAVKQFDSEEVRDNHIAFMRKNHMDALMHKRDETVYEGIRTRKNSLKACINCHVPVEFEGKPLRHTDSRHFCSTCHGYVAAQLDCFECHADHPQATQMSEAPQDSIHNQALANQQSLTQLDSISTDPKSVNETNISVVTGESISE